MLGYRSPSALCVVLTIVYLVLCSVWCDAHGGTTVRKVLEDCGETKFEQQRKSKKSMPIRWHTRPPVWCKARSIVASFSFVFLSLWFDFDCVSASLTHFLLQIEFRVHQVRACCQPTKRIRWKIDRTCELITSGESAD
jgi:hypothetical protein